MKRAAFILVALLAFSPFVSSQSKQENKWYNKTIEKGTVAAYDAFLKRYPKSIYCQQIDSLRHDALFVTHMGNAEAFSIISDLLPKLKQDVNQPEFFKAAALRDNGRDFIVGVSVREDDMPSDSLRVYWTEKHNGIWRMPSCRSAAKPFSDSLCVYSVLLEEENIISIEDGKWLHFTYRNVSPDGERMEHVEALMPVGAYAFDNQDPAVVSEMFCGSHLSGNRIEGILPKPEDGGKYAQWELFLFDRLRENESLVEIAREDLLTDQSVAWWLQNNPKAHSNAKSVKFGVLPDNCSIVRYYKSNREKEQGAGWTAALFDIRGYSVICAKSPSGKYTLLWCEPRFKDRSSDRILNSIYFENNTIVLFYYQGRRAFKYKINLSSKAILR